MKYFFKPFFFANTTTRMALCISLYVLVALMLSSCSTYRINRLKNKSYKQWKAYQWAPIKRSSDKEIAAWTIYSRKVKGTNLQEYKIEGTITSSPEACIIAFKNDIQDHADNPSKKYPTYDILHRSEDSLLTYVIHNEPFPFKDTEMSVQYLFSKDEDGSTTVKWNEAWDEASIEQSKKLNRVEIFRGSWKFSSFSEDLSIGLNWVQFDPKGMPKWLVQPMVSKFLKKGLEKISEAALK